MRWVQSAREEGRAWIAVEGERAGAGESMDEEEVMSGKTLQHKLKA